MLAALVQAGGVAAATDAEGVLGSVPHMLRGALTGFSQAPMKGLSHGMCTACSAAVVHAYRTDGWEFVSRVLGVR